MKLIRIMQDVSLPSMPMFKKGQQVRVNDEIADLLVTRGHAKREHGKTEDEVRTEKKVKDEKENGKKERKKVSVTKSSGKAE